MHVVLHTDFGTKSAMSGSRSMRKRKVVGKAETEDMAPVDVDEFRTDIVHAGARLANLIVAPFPKARLVEDALFAVTEIVKCYGLMGRWVTSRASGAHGEFLATDSVCEVSGCLAFSGMNAKFVLLTFSLL